MKSVIIGTAGHIDHGKTALIKALTGIDADRLAEEKRRGITIDIGFAHLELPAPPGYKNAGEKLRLGFVDVPGHERFVRNMLAGIGGIDLVLFIVAADEGIKPQTREHFDICRLLTVRRGITVLTKSDLVDADTLQVVKLEVEEFLRGSFLDSARAPILAVSAKNFFDSRETRNQKPEILYGIAELKRELARISAEVPARDSGAYFRLPMDRVFTMKGFGTVVTGTLISGSLRKEDEAEIFPQQTRARVRGLQVHGKAAEKAMAGERTALNLAGERVSTGELSRGMVLAPAGVFQPTQRIDIALTLLQSAKPLRDRARVHLHAYTAEIIAEVVLLEGKQAKPGETVFAQLRLAEKTLLLPGDRFILRQFSPMITIGGGVVHDAAPLKQKSQEHLKFLSTLTEASGALPQNEKEKILLARIQRRGAAGLDMATAIAETGWRKSELEAAGQALAQSKQTVLLGGIWLAAVAFASSQSAILIALAEFHKKNPLSPGVGREELREHVRLSQEAFAGLMGALLQERKLEIAGEQVRAAGRKIVMKEDESESQRVIERAFASAGLKVPALKDVLAGLKIDQARAQRIVTLLLREKILVKLRDDLVFHQDALLTLRKTLTDYKTRSSNIDVGQFKDLTGVSRKYAIPLLEYLDRERITRRMGDVRAIL